MIEFACLGVAFGIVFFLWKARISYLLLGRLPVVEASVQADVTVIIPGREGADAAVRQAKTKWLLFAAADTSFDPRFASSVVAFAERHGYQALTAFLSRSCISVAEKALLPYSLALYFTGVRARSLNRGGLANDRCLLVLREAYERMGGHGLAMRAIRAEHLGSVRLYRSAGEIWRGVQENSVRFLQAGPGLVIQVIVASILLTLWLPVLLLSLADYPAPFTFSMLLAPTPAMLLFFAPLLTLLPWYAESRPGRMWRVVLFPLAIYVFEIMAIAGVVTALIRKREQSGGLTSSL